MKRILPFISVILMTLHAWGVDDGSVDKLDIAVRAFVAELKDAEQECYLVAVYDARIGQKPISKPQMDFKATIVGVVRGRRHVGDKIEFDRVSEDGFENPQEYEGLLYYVFYRKIRDEDSPFFGQYYVSSQDPRALFAYSIERAACAAKVNKIEGAEQQAGASDGEKLSD